MNKTTVFGAAAGVLAAVGASGAPNPVPSGAPLWPHRVVGELTITGNDIPRFLAAQLDGKGGQELIAVTDAPGGLTPSRTRKRALLSAYRLDGTKFRLIAQGAVPLTWIGPVAGDLDRDGHDELYGINPRGELATIRQIGNRFQVTNTSRPSPWVAGDLIVSDVRQPGRPELVIAYDKKARELNVDADCDWLIAFRPDGKHWKSSWREKIHQTHFSFRLLSGPCGPGAGSRLVYAHLPSDISSSEYEVMDWSAGRPTRRAHQRTDSEREMGLQQWVGVGAHLTAAPAAIVSRTLYYLPQAKSGSPARGQGELLEWNGSTYRARYTTYGEPVAVGEFQRRGTAGVLVQKSKDTYELHVGRGERSASR